jgi:fumarylacetoacetase
MELSWGATQPVMLPGGETRCFLEDGDTVILRGWCGDGDARISLGDVVGTVVAAGMD